MSDIRGHFTRSPEAVMFTVSRLKTGIYHVEGDMGANWWADLCKELGLPVAGTGRVDLYFDVKAPLIMVSGTIQTELERECVRTLEAFVEKRSFSIDEVLAFGDAPVEMEDEVLPLEEDTLDVGEYIRQHIIANLEPYPIKDGGPRGGIILSDGLDEGTLNEKNPFAVLKQLKS